ncbi:MAG TPA: universal stress protein [Candidatus Eisenbacteria bacterium]|jgi:nucleotide-binding universal stress UspA family protein|nr:universal stress protein [Candidatus Eisenbacteria bacterium]
MRVLVGIDGSPASWEALQTLRSLSTPQEVLLVHAVDPSLPIVAAGAEVFVSAAPDLEKVLRERGEALLARATGCAPKGAPVTRHLLMGSPADVLLRVAEREQVELVVVGARGLGRVRELLLGSVSHRVIYHATCPVMVVHGDAQSSVRRVIAPVESAEDGEHLIRFLKKQPFPEPLEIRVLHVVPVADPLWPLDALQSEKHAREAIEGSGALTGGIAASLSALGHRASGVTGLGAAAESILREAESFGAQLVLMGARRRSGASRFLLGSVSYTIAHQARCPVLVLR